MTKRPNTLQSLFAEMMRRRVFRVMAVYGAVAFVLLQVVDIVLPALGVPEWAMSLILVIMLIGFPIAVVLAWAFETTPEGVRRTAPAAPEEIERIVAAPAKHRWPAGLLALAGMGLLFWAGWWMGNRGAENPANIIVSEAQASELKALAVLPFENVNGDDDNRLIAVGVHEDLLAQLSRIAALRVTSRSSVREYETTEKSPREIADELGVEFIMEGSVRSAGDQVRVTVTLVDPATNEQLWNQQYDEEVTPDNLFEIQSSIARQVVTALEAELTPQDMESLEAMEPASSLAAQSWYYRGIEAYSGGISELPAAQESLQRAVEIDPDFAAAWSYLTRVSSRLVWVGHDEAAEPARLARERTAELAPSSVEAYLADGFYEYYSRRDFDGALEAFREAERLAPSDADVAWGLGLILRRQGDWDASTEQMKRAARLDPRNALRLETLAENLQYLGAFEDADAVTERQLIIDPTNPRAQARKVELLIDMDGDSRRARTLAAELDLDTSVFEEANGLYAIAFADRDFERIIDISRQVNPQGVEFLERNTMGLRMFGYYALGESAAATAIADSLLERLASEAIWPEEAAVVSALAHSSAGRSDEALSAAAEARQLLGAWEDHVTLPGFSFGLIATYGRIGEIDAGFALLDDMVERPATAFAATQLRIRPGFDPYRDDPRFGELIERREAFEAESRRKAEAGRPWLP